MVGCLDKHTDNKVLRTPKNMHQGKCHEGNKWGTMKEGIKDELSLFFFQRQKERCLGNPNKENTLSLWKM